jgi:hypothetical protein
MKGKERPDVHKKTMTEGTRDLIHHQVRPKTEFLTYFGHYVMKFLYNKTKHLSDIIKIEKCKKVSVITH